VVTRERHLAAAEATARLVSALESGDIPGTEWIPTLVFYASIHLTESALAGDAIHPEGHQARANAIEDAWGDAAADLFEQLRDLSEQWRYSGAKPTLTDVAAAKDWASQLLEAAGVEWPLRGFLSNT
jgi:hypothetical protein